MIVEWKNSSKQKYRTINNKKLYFWKSWKF